jgi:predicted DNA-binding antitoxin AbrB/MazE fold protein
LVDWPIEVNAVYEGGVFKPDRPLPLAEGTRVRLTIEILPDETTVAKDVDDPTG